MRHHASTDSPKTEFRVFPFPRLAVLPRLKALICPNIYPKQRERGGRWIHAFFQGRKQKVNHKQARPRLELPSLGPFHSMITVTPRALKCMYGLHLF